MAKLVELRLNSAGVRELLKSSEIAGCCKELAAEVLSRCNKPGYEMAERRYPERTGYAVYAKEYPAIGDNLKNNTLLKAVESG